MGWCTWERGSISMYTGAFHTGTENRFTGSGSPIQSRVSSTRHADYVHCTAWLDLTHCHAEQQAARIRIEAVWRQSGLWIWIPDPHCMRIQGPVWRAPLSMYVHRDDFPSTQLKQCRFPSVSPKWLRHAMLVYHAFNVHLLARCYDRVAITGLTYKISLIYVSECYISHAISVWRQN